MAKRRNFSADFKAKVALAALRGTGLWPNWRHGTKYTRT